MLALLATLSRGSALPLPPKSSPFLSCGFVDISHWGPLAPEFTEERALDFDIVSVDEHHLHSSQLSRMRRPTSLVHRRCLAYAVVATGLSETGTSGGDTFFPKSHISLLPLGEPRKELHHHDLDLAMCQLRPRGDDNYYTQTYSETVGGPKGDLPHLATLAGGIQGSQMPFSLMSEFNMTPEKRHITGFLSKASASVATASEGKASCRSGRLLDDISLRALRQIQARLLVRPSRGAGPIPKRRLTQGCVRIHAKLLEQPKHRPRMSARGPIATLVAGPERTSLAKSPCRWTSTDDLDELTKELTGFGASKILLGATADSV